MRIFFFQNQRIESNENFFFLNLKIQTNEKCIFTKERMKVYSEEHFSQKNTPKSAIP